MSLVTVFAAESPEESCKNKGAYYVDYSGSKQYQCFGTLQSAVNSVEDNETAEIVFLDGNTFTYGTNTVSLNKNVTLNLNKQSVTFSGNGVWQVEGANVTIKNGTLDMVPNSVANRIKVNGVDKATTLTIAKDVTVKGDRNALSVVEVLDASEKTVVNINGKWEIANEIVNCVQDKDEDLTINLNATVKSENASNPLVKLDAGKSVVNVNGGTYTAAYHAFIVTNGTLNVIAGDITSTDKSAIVVNKADKNLTNSLNIKGGNIVSKNGYAVVFNDEDGNHSISGGKLTSSKDKDKKQLPALHIKNNAFLANHKNMITGGSFTGSIVGDVEDGERTTKAEYAVADLVGNATVKRC